MVMFVSSNQEATRLLKKIDASESPRSRRLLSNIPWTRMNLNVPIHCYVEPDFCPFVSEPIIRIKHSEKPNLSLGQFINDMNVSVSYPGIQAGEELSLDFNREQRLNGSLGGVSMSPSGSGSSENVVVDICASDSNSSTASTPTKEEKSNVPKKERQWAAQETRGAKNVESGEGSAQAGSKSPLLSHFSKAGFPTPTTSTRPADKGPSTSNSLGPNIPSEIRNGVEETDDEAIVMPHQIDTMLNEDEDTFMTQTNAFNNAQYQPDEGNERPAEPGEIEAERRAVLQVSNITRQQRSSFEDHPLRLVMRHFSPINGPLITPPMGAVGDPIPDPELQAYDEIAELRAMNYPAPPDNRITPGRADASRRAVDDFFTKMRQVKEAEERHGPYRSTSLLEDDWSTPPTPARTVPSGPPAGPPTEPAALSQQRSGPPPNAPTEPKALRQKRSSPPPDAPREPAALRQQRTGGFQYSGPNSLIVAARGSNGLPGSLRGGQRPIQARTTRTSSGPPPNALTAAAASMIAQQRQRAARSKDWNKDKKAKKGSKDDAEKE
ncbi:uncharacterized protein PAC_17293 [Phialocephala subalpina]|uniref:Uncharacterized protein n=1 Tax=Phialocephala subalpina TaxID=576137 RepID=A0A1L7XQS1_9HELO|nr:uncharacterized protein PAC_17293 [Phialocephala subalpina]